MTVHCTVISVKYKLNRFNIKRIALRFTSKERILVLAGQKAVSIHIRSGRYEEGKIIPCRESNLCTLSKVSGLIFVYQSKLAFNGFRSVLILFYRYSQMQLHKSSSQIRRLLFCPSEPLIWNVGLFTVVTSGMKSGVSFSRIKPCKESGY